MTFNIVNVGTIFAFERQKFERPYTQAVCFPCYYFVMSLEWNANSVLLSDLSNPNITTLSATFGYERILSATAHMQLNIINKHFIYRYITFLK